MSNSFQGLEAKSVNSEQKQFYSIYLIPAPHCMVP